MDTRTVTDLVHFDDEGARSEILHDTAQLFSEVICLQGSQALGPMSDEAAAGLVIVLSGEVAAQVGGSRARLRQWASVTVDPGVELTIRNASAEPSVVLLVLAPPPA